MKMLKLALGGFAAIAIGGLALGQSGQGLWPTLPVVGGAAYCSSTTNGVCTNTVPAGPAALTGNEGIPANTNLSQGRSPQSVIIPPALLANGGSYNYLFGGDFGQNLWQRATTFTSLTPTTATLTADAWYAYSSGNTVTITRQQGTSDIPVGSTASMRVNRPSGTDVTPICVGQVAPASESTAFRGRNAIFSFSALAGGSFSAASSNVSVTVAYYTAADSATAGTNTDAFAKSTIAGYAATTATQAINTTMTRYFTVPVAIPSTATGVGVKICYTPVGTGTSADWFEFGLAQLEARTGSSVGPSAFQWRTFGDEAVLQRRRSWVITDGAATLRYASCQAYTTAIAHCFLQYPGQMRITTPTVTVGTTISWAVTTASGTAQACGTSIAPTTTGVTANGVDLTCTTGATALVAGSASQMIGAATGGLLTVSAEP